MSIGHVLNHGPLCWSPFQHMAGDSLGIYELRKVDKACRSQEKRRRAVKRGTPCHAGGLRQSCGRALCGAGAAPLQALSSGPGSALPLQRVMMERFDSSALSRLKGNHHGLRPQDGSMRDTQEPWAVFGSGQWSLRLQLEGGIAGDCASI